MSKSKADQTKEGRDSTILFNILKGTTFLYKGVTNCGFRKLVRCKKYVDILAWCAGYALDDKYGDACKAVSDFSGPEVLTILETKGKVCIRCAHTRKFLVSCQT